MITNRPHLLYISQVKYRGEFRSFPVYYKPTRVSHGRLDSEHPTLEAAKDHVREKYGVTGFEFQPYKYDESEGKHVAVWEDDS